MSSAKVRKVFKQLSFTSTWSVISTVPTLTVTAASPHRLITGDKVDLHSDTFPGDFIQATVTRTNDTVFTIETEYKWTAGLVKISIFRASDPTGDAGRIVFSAPRSTGAAAVVQSWVTGDNGVVYDLQGSLDGVHWSAIATVTHTNGTTIKTSVTDAWAYLGMKITTAVGAATILELMYSS